MMKRIISICMTLLASTHALAFGQQNQNGAPELSPVSLCQITNHLDQYQNKVVCVQASLQSVNVYSYVLGVILTSPDCDPVDVRFEKDGDEETILNALREADTEEAQVMVIGKLFGPASQDTEYSYGMKGVFKCQFVVESIAAIKPLQKGH